MNWQETYKPTKKMLKTLKEVKGVKKKNLTLKVTDENDESYLYDEYIALIRRDFKKFFKKGMNS